MSLASPDPAAVELRGLVKTFRRLGQPPVTAVRGIDLTIAAIAGQVHLSTGTVRNYLSSAIR